jgi:hypothetical protein
MNSILGASTSAILLAYSMSGIQSARVAQRPLAGCMEMSYMVQNKEYGTQKQHGDSVNT